MLKNGLDVIDHVEEIMSGRSNEEKRVYLKNLILEIVDVLSECYTEEEE